MIHVSNRRVHLLINFIAFQCAWFALVLGAAHDFLWRGIAVAVLVMLLHLLMSRRPARELQLITVTILLGTVWDSALSATEVIQYPSGQFSVDVAPVWIMAMWGLFATTLNVSLVFMRGRYLLAAAFGVIGAPLSFMAGMRLQALQFPHLTLAMVVIAAGWAVLMPVLMYLSVRFDGMNVSNKGAI
jgi:hypothetical protein